MKNAYAALGVLILIVLAGAFFAAKRAEAPAELNGNETTMLTLTSTAFEPNGSIPPKYTCDASPPAGGTIPPLSISGTPGGAKSLVLIMDDPDIPESVKQSRGIEVFDHWVVFNIPPETTLVAEGAEPAGVLGRNGAGRPGYTGPCPPDREPRYFFKLYALDTELTLPEGASKADVETAMEGHILAQTELIGRYERQP